jgi:hypothetical protein
MTSPVEEIEVLCPKCGTEFRDWTRRSVNLDLDDVDDDYVRAASTATCPSYGFVVDLRVLIRGRAETRRVADELRRLAPESELLDPGVFRGTLWLQAARFEIDRLLRKARLS